MHNIFEKLSRKAIYLTTYYLLVFMYVTHNALPRCFLIFGFTSASRLSLPASSIYSAGSADMYIGDFPVLNLSAEFDGSVSKALV